MRAGAGRMKRPLDGSWAAKLAACECPQDVQELVRGRECCVEIGADVPPLTEDEIAAARVRWMDLAK